MSKIKKCEQIVSTGDGFRFYACGKPSKGISSYGKRHLCGIHLRAEKTREKNANKRNDDARQEREYASEVTELLSSIGVSGHSNGYRLRMCIVNFDELKGFVEINKDNLKRRFP